MGRRQRHRANSTAGKPATDYVDGEGNVLRLRDGLSEGTVRKLREPPGGPAASADDRWQRHEEMLFERLAIRWTIAGLPLEGQRELLGRYRIADAGTRRWVRGTLDDHLAKLAKDRKRGTQPRA